MIFYTLTVSILRGDENSTSPFPPITPVIVQENGDFIVTEGSPGSNQFFRTES